MKSSTPTRSPFKVTVPKGFLLRNRYTSAFTDNRPETSAISSHYQAPSPPSRGSSHTAHTPEPTDPEGSALLGKVSLLCLYLLALAMSMLQPILLLLASGPGIVNRVTGSRNTKQWNSQNRCVLRTLACCPATYEMCSWLQREAM